MEEEGANFLYLSSSFTVFHTHSRNIEVVVSVHATRNATSKPTQPATIPKSCCGRPTRLNNNFGTATRTNMMIPWHKSTSSREQTDCVCVFMDNCSNLPAAHGSSTSAGTLLRRYPHSFSHECTRTIVEEGIRDITPSSSEISKPEPRSVCYFSTHLLYMRTPTT